MYVVVALVAVAVVVAAAVVASGRGGGLEKPEVDRVDAGLPVDEAMLPEDVAGLRFRMALRGYRMSEVDAVLDRLAAELAARDAQLTELTARLAGPAMIAEGPADA